MKIRENQTACEMCGSAADEDGRIWTGTGCPNCIVPGELLSDNEAFRRDAVLLANGTVTAGDHLLGPVPHFVLDWDFDNFDFSRDEQGDVYRFYPGLFREEDEQPWPVVAISGYRFSGDKLDLTLVYRHPDGSYRPRRA